MMDERQRRVELTRSQVQELVRNGIRVLESRPIARMVVVKKSDLETATRLKISDEITIASRC